MLNKSSLILLCFVVLAACTPSHTIPQFDYGPQPRPKPTPRAMSEVSYLRKLSLHLRGQTPEREEYAALTRATEKKTVPQFFKDKAAEYLASPQHADKMSFRLEELFQVRASAVPYHAKEIIDASDALGDTFKSIDSYTIKNSMNEAFRRTIQKNLSWDTLLTGKNYRAYPLNDESLLVFNMGDFLFYSQAAGVPRDNQSEAEITFPADDARVAGVLTTGRFFARNVNTALNKNRRRAATIFRTFLCDDMKAVIVDESGNQNEILDRVFPGVPGGGNGGGKAQNGSGDIHGSDPACMKCHHKLDPMGRTFQDSGMLLAKLASPGALVFTGADGRKVNIPVHGLGELGQVITQQPEYLSCQVGYFWKWFIGEDKPLTPQLTAELVRKFEEVQRKPNDFIAYLVARPEFGYSQNPESNEVLIGQVKNVLKNCNGCHAVEKIPSFTSWPIGGTEAKHLRWLPRIRKSLSLDGSSAPRTMPPKTSRWQPTPPQIETLQRWFDMGAPNE